jgi:hypothetical protein
VLKGIKVMIMWHIIQGWLFIFLMLGGVALIVIGAAFGTGVQAVLATFIGIGCIVAGLGGLHG